MQSVAEVDPTANSHWSFPELGVDLSSERGAEFSLAAERVVGRLRGGEAALGAAVGWVCSATGAAG